LARSSATLFCRHAFARQCAVWASSTAGRPSWRPRHSCCWSLSAVGPARALFSVLGCRPATNPGGRCAVNPSTLRYCAAVFDRVSADNPHDSGARRVFAPTNECLRRDAGQMPGR
jgi:hypothetical protein